MFRKHDHVEYIVTASGQHVDAIVRIAHRDGTCTVEARHFLEDGKPRGAYLGYRYRMPAADLFQPA